MRIEERLFELIDRAAAKMPKDQTPQEEAENRLAGLNTAIRDVASEIRLYECYENFSLEDFQELVASLERLRKEQAELRRQYGSYAIELLVPNHASTIELDGTRIEKPDQSDTLPYILAGLNQRIAALNFDLNEEQSCQEDSWLGTVEKKEQLLECMEQREEIIKRAVYVGNPLGHPGILPRRSESYSTTSG